MSSQTTIVEPTGDQVAAIVDPLIQDNPQIGVAVGVVGGDFDDNGAIYYQGALVNHAGDPLPLDESTSFEIASVSKTFTATLFALLGSRSTDVWNGTLAQYQPSGTDPLYPDYGDLALRWLATYTSGLPRDNSDPTDQPKPLPQPYTVADMYGYLSQERFPVDPQDTTYLYSNLGFALLGQSMLAAAGKPASTYPALLTRDVLQPLGMTGTAPIGAVPADQMPLGFRADGSKAPIGWPQNPAYVPAGGLVSTPADVFTWLAFNMGLVDDAALKPLLALTQTPQTTVKTLNGSQLGLGWFLSTMSTPGGTQPFVWKDGGLAGFSSYLAFLPSSDPGSAQSAGGVFVLTNSHIPSGRIALNVLRVMLGYPYVSGVDAAQLDTDRLI